MVDAATHEVLASKKSRRTLSGYGPKNNMKNRVLAGRSFVLPLLRAVLALSIGGCIYVLFRPRQLVLFDWLADLGLTRHVEWAREWAAPWRSDLSEWALYTLPDALWLYSLLEITAVIWSSARRARYAAFAVIGALAAGLEISEAFLPGTGTFSFPDLAAIVLVLTAVFWIHRMKQQGEQE